MANIVRHIATVTHTFLVFSVRVSAVFKSKQNNKTNNKKKSDLRKVAFFIVALTAAARLQVAKCAVSLANNGHCRLILNKDRV